MRSLIKGVVLFLVAILALVGLAIFALVMFLDPNDYRDDISRLVKEKTGMVLQLDGELSWRLYPVLGFGVNDVAVAVQDNAPTLARFNEVTMGLKIRPLLRKKLAFDAIHAVGLQAHLVVDERGKNNWTLADTAENPTTQSEQEPSPHTQNTRSETISLSIPLISIRDSNIYYEDKTSGDAYTMTVSLLELTDVNLNDPFPFTLAARVQDAAGLDIATNMEGQITALLEKELFIVNNLSVKAAVGGIFEKVANLTVQGNVTLDQKNDNATFDFHQISLENIDAQLNGRGKGLSTEPEFSGTFQTSTFNAKTLMSELGIPPLTTANPGALQRVSVNTDFFASSKQSTSQSITAVRFHPFQMTLDDSALSGEITVTDMATQALRFALQLDELNIDHYLSADTAKAPGTNTANDEELIPVELLQSLNMQGQFNAQALTVKNSLVTNLALTVSALDGNIRLSDIGASVFQGLLSGNVSIDARKQKPIIDTNIQMQDIELSDALKTVSANHLMSGKTNLKFATTTQGNAAEELLQQALGQLHLDTQNAVIHGLNINDIVVQKVKEKLGDASALLPDYEQKLPKALKDKTQLKNLLVDIKIENGRLLIPPLSTETSEGTLSAQGNIDLVQQSVDYRFGVLLSALSGSKYFNNVSWPVHCKAALSAPVASWCRPDTKAFGEIFEKAAQQAVLDKAANRLGDKLGVQDANQDEVKNTLEEKAKKEEERAKQKLKEKLESLLNSPDNQ